MKREVSKSAETRRMATSAAFIAARISASQSAPAPIRRSSHTSSRPSSVSTERWRETRSFQASSRRL